jgi:hypothetical protein
MRTGLIVVAFILLVLTLFACVPLGQPVAAAAAPAPDLQALHVSALLTEIEVRKAQQQADAMLERVQAEHPDVVGSIGIPIE